MDGCCLLRAVMCDVLSWSVWKSLCWWWWRLLLLAGRWSANWRLSFGRSSSWSGLARPLASRGCRLPPAFNSLLLVLVSVGRWNQRPGFGLRAGKWWLAFTFTCNMRILTLKAPRKTASENVVCLCRLLNSNLFLHTGKQCGPRSDCSLIWVHTVCKNDF